MNLEVRLTYEEMCQEVIRIADEVADQAFMGTIKVRHMEINQSTCRSLVGWLYRDGVKRSVRGDSTPYSLEVENEEDYILLRLRYR